MPVITVRRPSGPPVSYRYEQDRITIGRGGGNDLVVADPALSRSHAELRREGVGWVVEDSGSRNGTRLNGRSVTRAQPLKAGDEIALGDVRILFDVEAPASRNESAGRETDRISWSRRGTGRPEGEPEFIGESEAIRQVAALVDRVADSISTVLVVGENGTGKELAARRLHARSARRGGPFVVINCPALPGSLLEAELFGVEKGVATGVEPRVGRFETARGGTLLLDEIGDLDAAAQAKILRAIQDRTIERIGGREPIALDVRMVAATHHDLEADIARGTFRRDLYHRLNVVTIALPPLRSRLEDIPLLVEHFLAQAGGGVTMSEEALELLARYDFPGNVRELEHLVERARLLATGPVITPADLPDAVLRSGSDGRRAPEALRPGSAEEMYRRIVDAGESFWDIVATPFLRREVSRDEARRLIATAYEQAGGSYKNMARLFRIEAEHKRLLTFLRNHRLGVDAD